MQLLAIDTSTDRSAVAVVRDGRALAEELAQLAPEGEGAARHGDVLLPRIAAQLAAAGTKLSAIDLIAVGLGPGSFTGLRVGLATAKGLALALGIPLRGASSLEAIARGAFDAGQAAPGEPLFVVLDAGRGELYAQGFAAEGAALRCIMGGSRDGAEALIARLAEAARGAPCALCGSGVRSHGEPLRAALGGAARFADPSHDLPRAADLARVAAQAFAAEGPSDLAALEPLYLRDSDAKLPAKPLAL